MNADAIGQVSAGTDKNVRECPMRVALLFVAALVLAGCKGPRSGGSDGDDAACWPVRPMVLEALEHGAEWEPISAIEADGTIVHLAKGRRPMGRLENDRLVGAGKTVLTCDADRHLSMPGLAGSAGYDAEGAFVEKETRILVTDDGTVVMTSHGAAVFGPDGKGHARVRGATGGARRTAALLVLLSLGGPPG